MNVDHGDERDIWIEQMVGEDVGRGVSQGRILNTIGLLFETGAQQQLHAIKITERGYQRSRVHDWAQDLGIDVKICTSSRTCW
jgi:hypothetical protein